MALVTVLLAADLLPGGGGRRRARGELGDGVTVMQLGVTGDVVVTRMATLRRVLDRQHVEIGAAVVFGVTRRCAIRLGGGWSSVLEAVCLLQLLGRLEDEVDAVGALVIHAAAAHRLREVHDHRPWHPGQVAQIALRPLAHHLAGEKRGVGAEELLLFDDNDGGGGGDGSGGDDSKGREALIVHCVAPQTYHFTSTVCLAHVYLPSTYSSYLASHKLVSELSPRLIVRFALSTTSLSLSLLFSNHSAPRNEN